MSPFRAAVDPMAVIPMSVMPMAMDPMAGRQKLEIICVMC